MERKIEAFTIGVILGSILGAIISICFSYGQQAVRYLSMDDGT